MRNGWLRSVNPLPGVAAIFGAGGLGKTTLAAALCFQDDVFTAFADGILWVTLGESPNITVGLTEICAALSGQRVSLS